MSARVLALLLLAAFPHRQHENIKTCTNCHEAGTEADALRPGWKDHSTCDGADCHARDFYDAKAAKPSVCLSCHSSAANFPNLTALKPYPPKGDLFGGIRDEQTYYAEFSHKKHLKRVEAPTKDKACLTCHLISPETKELVHPAHAACKNCHDQGPKPMAGCDNCHVDRIGPDGAPRKTSPRLKRRPGRVTGKFTHESHRLDRRRKEPTPVSCGTCHQSENADTLAEIVLTDGPRTMVRACGRCHDGKVAFATYGACTKCHAESMFDSSSNVPTTHQ